MDDQLRNLMRLNDKKRRYLDGYNVSLGEFSIFDIMEDVPKPIDVTPLNPHSLKTGENEQRRLYGNGRMPH